MKMYLNDRWCSCYTSLPRTALAAAQTDRKMAAPSTGTDASPVAQCLLTIAMPKQVHNINIHANKSKHKETIQQYMKTANKLV